MEMKKKESPLNSQTRETARIIHVMYVCVDFVRLRNLLKI